METVIEFRHIRKTYGDKVVLDDLTLLLKRESLSPLSVRPAVERRQP